MCIYLYICASKFFFFQKQVEFQECSIEFCGHVFVFYYKLVNTIASETKSFFKLMFEKKCDARVVHAARQAHL